MIQTSLLDTDLYKLTMMQGVLHQFPWAEVEYEFRCRNPEIDLTPIIDHVNTELDHLCTLRFTREELDYLRRLRFMKEDFMQFLRLFHLQRDFIHTWIENKQFCLRIKGPWLHTIMFEVPVLAIVNEVYFRDMLPVPNFEFGKEKLYEKITQVIQSNEEGLSFRFSDFGTRRRFSRAWSDEIISILQRELPGNLIGTSNLFFAKKRLLVPIRFPGNSRFRIEMSSSCQVRGNRRRVPKSENRKLRPSSLDWMTWAIFSYNFSFPNSKFGTGSISRK